MKSLSNKTREILKAGILMLCYAGIYFAWFGYLEKNVTKPEYLIHTAVDDVIPFVKIFVIPYYLWFAYCVVAVAYLLFTNREEFYRAFLFLATGMTLFLMVSTLWPNGHDLRPAYLIGDDLCTRLIAAMYRTDTPTNLWPSIHVYNSIGVHIALTKCEALRKKKGIRIASLILCLSIIASTMLIKQHSVFDVATAVLLSGLVYYVVYSADLIALVRNNLPEKAIG